MCANRTEEEAYPINVKERTGTGRRYFRTAMMTGTRQEREQERRREKQHKAESGTGAGAGAGA